jgi:predicted AlkP superfamily phosphohydrolase/phosphomutase
MGPDRLHHGFWRFYDPGHPDYEPGNPYEQGFRDYYRLLDTEVARLIEPLDDETAVLVVSDHGAQAMQGGIQVNEWLRQNGYLALAEEPAERTPIGKVAIDWPRTQAWADGGYYSRIFLNVADREPQGTVAPEAYEALRSELVERLEALGDEQGRSIGTRVRRPEDLYRSVNGVAPDLICYFGDLTWRSIGSVGDGRVHVRENDTGPDDANHACDGIYVMAGPGIETAPAAAASIYDIAPTVLRLMDEPVPGDMQGTSLI